MSVEVNSTQVARRAMASVPMCQFSGVEPPPGGRGGCALYIEANLEHRLDTNMLARVAYRRRAHFCRSSKRMFGVTVHQYVLQRRIERAQHLMLMAISHADPNRGHVRHEVIIRI